MVRHEKVDTRQYRKPICKRSSKKLAEDRAVRKILHEIVEEKGAVCQAKGSTCCDYMGLDPSHLIPRSQRPDLITCKKNIVPHCRNCHTIWEHGKIQEKMALQDFWSNMKIINMFTNRLSELYT